MHTHNKQIQCSVFTTRGHCASPNSNLLVWIMLSIYLCCCISPRCLLFLLKKRDIKLDPPVSAAWAFPLWCGSVTIWLPPGILAPPPQWSLLYNTLTFFGLFLYRGLLKALLSGLGSLLVCTNSDQCRCCSSDEFSESSVSPTYPTHIVLVKMPADSYPRLSVPSSVSSSVCSSHFCVSATFLSTNQLSRHSAPLPTPHDHHQHLLFGWSPVSLSHLLPSSYSTDHACSKNRSHFHPRCNPHPPCPAPLLSCITSFPNPSLVRSSCPSPPTHLPIAPPLTPPVHPPSPPQPIISSHAGIWRRVPVGCPPILSP